MILNIPYEIYNTFDDRKFFTSLMDYQGDYCSINSACKTANIAIAGEDYYIKQHSGVGYLEILKNMFRFRLPILSAKNEWLALEKCQQLGIATVPLVGYGENGVNPAKRQSFLITRALKNTPRLQQVMEEAWQKQIPSLVYKRKIIKQLAQKIRTFHQAGMYHQELYLDNFLLDAQQSEPQIYFIDLARVLMKNKISEQNRVKDLAALLYSSFNTRLLAKDYFYFLKIYSGKSLKNVMKDPMLMEILRRAKILYLKNYGCAPSLPAEFAKEMNVLERMNQKIPIQNDPYYLYLEDGSSLKVQRMLRIVPNKRWVAKATWQGKLVVAKIFVHASRFNRELKGIEKCQTASVLTPKILYQGKIPLQNAFVIIFEYIPTEEQQGSQLIENLIKTVAFHHNQGIMQTDLHVGNFIHNNNQMITLDTADIVTIKDPLDNFALLLSQFLQLSHEQIKDYFHWYGQLRNMTFNTGTLSEFVEKIEQHKERRKAARIKLVSKDSSAVTFWNRPNYKILMRNDAYSPRLCYFLHHIETENADPAYVLERYTTWNLFQPSPAVKRWRALHLAEFTGKADLIPVAVVEKTAFLRKTAYFIGKHAE